MQKLPEKLENRTQLARIAARVLNWMISALIILGFVLIFQWGVGLWPAGMIVNRPQIMRAFAFTLLILLLWRPMILKVAHNTRTPSAHVEEQ